MTKTELTTMTVFHLTWHMQYDWVADRWHSCDWLALGGWRL